MRSVRVAAQLVAAGLCAALLVGCTQPATPDHPGATGAAAVDDLPVTFIGSPDAPPPATWSEQLAQEMAQTVADAGRVSLQQLADAAALEFGSFPGARTSDLPPGDGVGSSWVLQMLVDDLDDLDPQQRAVAQKLLNPSPSPLGDEPAPVLTTADLAGQQTRLEFYQAAAEQVHADWLARVPSFLPGVAVQVEIIDPPLKPKAVMDTTLLPKGRNGFSDPLCSIWVYPANFETSGRTTDDMYLQLAHEWFHCYERQFRELKEMPGWLLDGAADWGKFWLYPQRATSADLINTDWLRSPSTDLSRRTYDAFVLFRAFQERGGDVFSAITWLLTLQPFPDALSALAHVGMTEQAFGLRLSEASTREASVGDWSLTWPLVAGESPKLPTVAPAAIPLGAFVIQDPNDVISQTPRLLTVAPEADVLRIVPDRGGAAVRASGTPVTLPEGKETVLCLRAGGCTCPDGRSIGVVVPGRELLFVFNALSLRKHAVGVAEAWDPDRFCADPDSGGVPASSGPATGRSNGDPHLTTYDGTAFDVMALGEFVLTRDPAGGFEAQIRNELYDRDDELGSYADLAGAVGTSAVALDVDGRRVTFSAWKYSFNPGDVEIRVDGAVLRGTDASIAVAEEGNGNTVWTVTAKDGSRVEVIWALGFFVTVTASEDRAGRMVGLLGAADGDPLNDLLLPDGTPLPAGSSYDDVYAQAWLVTDATTLFDYEPGRSPDYYHVVAPTPGEVLQGLIDFFSGATGGQPPFDSADAFDRCTDLLGPQASRDEVRSCAYDLAATGQIGIVGSYGGMRDDRLADEGGRAEALLDLVTGDPRLAPGVLAPVAGAPTVVLDTTDSGRRATIAVPEGAVVTFRTDDCSPSSFLEVGVSTPDGEILDPVGMCVGDPAHSIGSTGRDGEGYGIALTGGDYVFAIGADLPEGTTVAVTVDASPSFDRSRPGAPQLAGRVTALGDAMGFLLANPPGTAPAGATWPQRGIGDDACVLVLDRVEKPGEGPGWRNLGGECQRPGAIQVLYTFDDQPPVAVVVVARTDEPTRFEITRPAAITP